MAGGGAPLDIAIVGCGPSGMAAALFLSRAGHRTLLDAFALTEALAGDRDIDPALGAYVGSRRRHVRFYQAASRWMTPLFQSDSRAAAFARDLALPAMNLVPYLRHETVRTLAGLKTGLFASLDPADPLSR